jgi:mRNA interferase MazF
VAISYHPGQGSIVACDFRNLVPPEMDKKRPVIIMCKQIHERKNLCTVVPLSTTPPERMMPYHVKLFIDPPLPEPYEDQHCWVKTDLVMTVSFQRLQLMTTGKDKDGKRNYDIRVISEDEFKLVQQALSNVLGFI